MVDILMVLDGLVLFLLTLGFWAFTLLFHVLSNWRESAMGKHFMALMACCDLILTWTWVSLVFRPSLIVNLWIALVLYSALTLGVWNQVRMLVKMQIISRNDSDKILKSSRVMSDNSEEGQT